MRVRTTQALGTLTILLLLITGCTSPRATAPAADQPAPQKAALVAEVSAYPNTKLELEKYNGPVGTRIVMSGTGYPANQEVALSWLTYDGRWLLEENEVVFVGPRYDQQIEELGKVKADANGAVRFEFTAPEDFGGVHDIITRVDGKYATKTAFTITASFSVSPTSGPIGTPVIITATGLGYKQQLAQWHVAWDNAFTGYITGVTTRGTATGNIRLAGPPGKHVLKLWRNFRGIPYLNPHQGPFGALPPSEFVMTVTDGVHNAPTVWEHPKSVDTIRPTPQANAKGGAGLSLSSDQGVVGSTITISGTGFPANQSVAMTWATRSGQEIGASGLREGFLERLFELPAATAGSDGRFSIDYTIHDDFAGHHRITAQSGDKMAEAYYSIYANISEFTETVKVGEPIKIRTRGIGWNIQGKTYAVTVDNKYLGYICSFSTLGYIEFDLPAMVEPGIHIIDLYPAIYEGQDESPNVYSSPNLTYLYDHPGGALPTFRLTLTVTE